MKLLQAVCSESYRSIQKQHMPKLMAWLPDLNKALASIDHAAGNIASSSASTVGVDQVSTGVPLSAMAMLTAQERLEKMRDALSSFCTRVHSSLDLFDQLQQIAAAKRSSRPASQPEQVRGQPTHMRYELKIQLTKTQLKSSRGFFRPVII